MTRHIDSIVLRKDTRRYRRLTNLWTWIALTCAAISVTTYLIVLTATQPLDEPTTPDPTILRPYIEMNIP